MQSAALILLTATCANATLVVYEWGPNEILLAADSLRARVQGAMIRGEVACKIHQQGSVFFTIVGVNDDTTINVDLVAVANEAARANGGIVEKMATFDRLAMPQIQRIMKRGLTQQLGFGEAQRVNVVFLDAKSHAIGVREYRRENNGSTVSKAPVFYRAPSRPSGPTAIGVFAEAQAYVLKTPALSRLDGVPFIIGFIQAQIDHERYRIKTLKTMPRVGGKITVLRVRAGMASWADGYQGPCPAIQHTQK